LNALDEFLAPALAAVALLGLTVFHSAASAEPGPRGANVNVMVAGEDADPDTIPRGSQVFNRVLQALSEELKQHGIRVYAEVGPPPAPERVRRKLHELIGVAQNMTAPIDLIVVFQIYGTVSPAKDYDDAHRPAVRIGARMIRVRGGEELGGTEFGSDIEFPLIPSSCVFGNPPRQCLLQKLGDDAAMLAPKVGRDLAIKLEAFVHDPSLVCDSLDGTPYLLTVVNFEDAELSQLEQFLAGFACYQSIKAKFIVLHRAEYWYETSANSVHLQSNLRTALQALNIRGDVSFSGGNKILVDKIGIAPPGGVLPPR
jgi:hypothetical protein